MRPRPGWLGQLSLRRLELVAIVAPMLFLGAVYAVVLGPEHPAFHRWPGFLLLVAVLAVSVWSFTRAVFGAVRALQAEVESLSDLTRRHNQQLVSLHGADLALMRETRVEDAFRRIAELGGPLIDACHASLEAGAPGTAARVFTHPAWTPTTPPVCALERAGETGEQPAPARSADPLVLTVPLALLGTPIGTLRIARAFDAAPFTPGDVEVARMFATHAALVVQNDRLYDEVRALAIEGERQALARDMHDSLAQVLAFVNTKAQAVELYLRRDDIASARQQMAELSAAARAVYADVREGIGALRVDLAGKGLGELVGGYAREFAESTGLEVHVDWRVDDDALGLPAAADLQLLRVVQEALANVRRHAAARRIWIEATRDRDELSVVVADDGRGLDPAARTPDGRPRFGLQTMAERANAVGGTVTIESSPGGGTRVRVALPLTPPTEPSGAP